MNVRATSILFFFLSMWLIPLMSMEKQTKLTTLNDRNAIAGERFLQALEAGNEPAAHDILASMNEKNWPIDYKSANYLLQEGRVRFAPFVYKTHQPSAVEAFMRILETSARRRVLFPLTPWCKENNLEEQPVDHENHCWMPCFEYFSPAWYHIQRLRMATYLDRGFHGLDTKQRLISLAHEIGALCLDRADCVSAIPFLFPALCSGDQQTRDYLTHINANNHFVLLLGGSKHDRSQAWHSFRTLLCHDEEEAVRLAKTWSSALVTWIKSLAKEGDYDAAGLFAFHALLSNADVPDAYGAIAAIADDTDPWLLYLYGALAEKLPHKANDVYSFMLNYFNLLACKEPYIEAHAYQALKQYADKGSELAIKLLSLHETGSDDINAYIEALSSLQGFKKKRYFFEYYLASVIENSNLYTTQTTCYAAQKTFLDAIMAAHGHGFYPAKSITDFCRGCGFMYDNASDDRHALPFLRQAAFLHDRESQKRLAKLCARNPVTIVPAMHELRPFLECAAFAKKDYAQVANLYLLMAGDEQSRSQAFAMLCNIAATNPSLVFYAANHKSAELQQICDSLIKEGDKYSILIQALFALQGAVLGEDTRGLLLSIKADGNPWITYIQSAIAEKGSEKNKGIKDYLDGYHSLLHCGDAYLEAQSLEALKRAIEAGDVKAYALLFCDVCQTSDKKSAVKVLMMQSDNKPLFAYLLEHCVDCLQRVGKRNAIAAYVLGRCYEEKSNTLSEDGSPERFEMMRQAIDAFVKADNNGHPSRARVTPAMLISVAAYYHLQGNVTDAERYEDRMFSWCEPLTCMHALDQLLVSDGVTHERFEYFCQLYKRLAEADGEVAYQVARRYLDGYAVSACYQWLPDAAKAKEYLRCAANRSHPEGSSLYAKIMLKDETISHEARCEAVSLLRKFLPNNDHEATLLLHKAENVLEMKRRDDDINVLNYLFSDKKELNDAVKRLIALAQKGDHETMRFMGLWLHADQRYKQQLCPANVPLAIQFLDRFNQLHPDDMLVAKTLLILWSRLIGQEAFGDKERVKKVFYSYFENPVRDPDNIDLELMSKLFYGIGRFEEALRCSIRLAPTQESMWLKALCMLRKPERTEKEDHLLCEYLASALVLNDKKIALERDQMVDTAFALQALAGWKHSEAPVFIARIVLLLGGNHPLVKAMKVDYKKMVEDLFAVSNKSAAATSLLIFLAINKLWGVKLSGSLVDYCCHSLRLPLLCEATQVELCYRLSKIAKGINNVARNQSKSNEEKVEMLRAAYILGIHMMAATYTPSCKADGMSWFFKAEHFIYSEAERRCLQYILLSEGIDSLLQELACQHNNWYALVSLSACLTARCIHKALSWSQRMDAILNRFMSSVFNKQVTEFPDQRPHTVRCAALACGLWGSCHFMFRPEGQQSSRPFFEKALSLDAHEAESLWCFATLLLDEKGSSADASKGVAYLEELAKTTESAAPCFYLAKLALPESGVDNPWIKKEVKKAIYYLKMAAERGDKESLILYRAEVVKDEEPIVTKPKKCNIDKNSIKQRLLQAAAQNVVGNLEKAKQIYDNLINDYLDGESALQLAKLYQNNKEDFGFIYMGRYILQWFACQRYWGTRDLANPIFKELFGYLLKAGAQPNNGEAAYWANKIKKEYVTFKEECVKK